MEATSRVGDAVIADTGFDKGAELLVTYRIADSAERIASQCAHDASKCRGN